MNCPPCPPSSPVLILAPATSPVGLRLDSCYACGDSDEHRLLCSPLLAPMTAPPDTPFSTPLSQMLLQSPSSSNGGSSDLVYRPRPYNGPSLSERTADSTDQDGGESLRAGPHNCQEERHRVESVISAFSKELDVSKLDRSKLPRKAKDVKRILRNRISAYKSRWRKKRDFEYLVRTNDVLKSELRSALDRLARYEKKEQ